MPQIVNHGARRGGNNWAYLAGPAGVAYNAIAGPARPGTARYSGGRVSTGDDSDYLDPYWMGGEYTDSPTGPFGYNSAYMDQSAYYGNPYDMLYANWADARFAGQDLDEDLAFRDRGFADDYLRYRDMGDAGYGYGEGGGYLDSQVYSPAERDAIIRSGQYNSLLGDDATWDAMNYTPDEISGITGDPYAAHRAWQGGIDRYDRAMQDWDTGSAGALDSIAGRVRGVSDDYTRGSESALGAGAGTLRGILSDTGSLDEALSGGEGSVRRIYDDPALRLSQEFQDQYKFGQSDIDNLETLSGSSVGQRYADMKRDVEQAARRQGISSPVGIAAYGQRAAREEAAQAADAALAARIGGKRQALDVTRTREGMRLDAEGRRAQMGTEAELALGDRRLREMQRRQGTALDVEGGLLDREMDRRRSAAELASGSERYIGSNTLSQLNTIGEARNRAAEFNTTTGTNLMRDIDRDSAARAAALAEARQSQARYAQGTRFSQGRDVQDRLRAGEQTVADQRLTFDAERRRRNDEQAQAAARNSQATSAQRLQQWANRRSAMNTAGGNYADYRGGMAQLGRQPGTAERILTGALGAGTSAASAYFGRRG